MKKRVIAYLHTHWDREWYREFEVFRLRLLRVFDEVLDALEKNLIPSFYFDGQVVALLDYLKIRPDKEALVRELISKKKLFIGPFYCLVDEFLTSAELFDKNLELGLKVAKEFGCEDFVGYLADTFGHSDGVIKALNKYGIKNAFVWRGCGELPSEFIWKDSDGNLINTTNLIRGYFMDIFTANVSIEDKAKFLRSNLDKIAEKSSDVLLLPIGGDHLGIPTDIKDQISQVNNLLEDYEIELGSIFDYLTAVEDNYKIVHQGELRDNSKTFVLEGSYSSRADLKQLNIESTYKLIKAEKFVEFYDLKSKYSNVLEYAYKLLLKNQAHDSICGCSTDDTHYENITRYKKIIQISETIIDEIRFEKNLYGKLVNLGHEPYSGVIERTKYDINLEDIVFEERLGFRKDLLADTKRVPITEDFLPVYKVLEYVENVQYGEQEIIPVQPSKDIETTENKIFGQIEVVVDDVVKIISNGRIIPIYLKDFKDMGDSYNRGVVEGDNGIVYSIKSSRCIYNSPLRGCLEVVYANDVRLVIALDADSKTPRFSFEIDNKTCNHHLQLCVHLEEPIIETLSEDMNRIISRKFDPSYDIRNNLPKEKGLEARSNNAPCQRLVWTQGVGIVLKGVTQYEVYGNELRLSLLRATGVISNPNNTTRTTPAGPPLPVKDLQLQKKITQNLTMFLADNQNLQTEIERVFNYII